MKNDGGHSGGLVVVWWWLFLGLSGCLADDGIEPTAQLPNQQVRGPSADARDLVLLVAPGVNANQPDLPLGDLLLSPSAGWSGVRFTAAYAQSSRGFQSTASLLTGRYPSAIPVCGLPNVDDAKRRPWCADIPEEVYTLPQILEIYGYRTALFSTDFPVADVLGRTFGTQVDLSDEVAAEQWSLEPVVSAALKWWQSNSDKPRFMMVNAGTYIPLRRFLIEQNARGEMQGSQEAVSTVGAAFARLVEGMRAAATSRPIVVAITSSAGLARRRYLSEESLHVPLAFVFPTARFDGEVIDIPVELRDVFPTLVAQAQGTLPIGVTSQDLLAGRDDDAWRAHAYAELGDMLSVRYRHFLFHFRAFIHSSSALNPLVTERLVKAHLKQDGNYALYDLQMDPNQANNLLSQEPDVARSMHTLLAEIRTGDAAPAASAKTFDHIWDLRMTASQGYW